MSIWSLEGLSFTLDKEGQVGHCCLRLRKEWLACIQVALEQSALCHL